MSEGISPNSQNDISKVYLDQIAAFREIRKQETQKILNGGVSLLRMHCRKKKFKLMKRKNHFPN